MGVRGLLFSLIIMAWIVSDSHAQPWWQNRKPKIVGQVEVTINEDELYMVKLTDLFVEDRNDWFYPFGFTLHLYPGENYTFEGTTLKPAANFFGELKVKVAVHDGEDYSNKYNFRITVRSVNDPPAIIAQQQTPSVEQNQELQIKTEWLQIDDPDNNYPDDFTVEVQPSAQNLYASQGDRFTPGEQLLGEVTIPIRVSDGASNSPSFSFRVNVLPANDRPEILSQKPLEIQEDHSIALSLDHFIVEDSDNRYPDDFTLTVASGKNYTVDNTTITPAKNYYGQLSVTVRVNDGTTDSPPFQAVINVVAVNDVPEIVNIEEDPLDYKTSEMPVAITAIFETRDPEGDSIAFAEIGFLSGSYQPGVDRLIFDGTSTISGQFNAASGTLVLQGPAIAAAFNEAVRAVRYENQLMDQPLLPNKIIFIRVSDGEASSEATRILLGNELIVELDIPTAFTPNGDNSNDTWVITPLAVSEEISSPIVRIYNPKGILLFEGTGFDQSWDGTFRGELLPSGVYYYTIDLNVPLGNRRPIKGAVSILR